MPMTSRERVLATLHHEQPDRIPLVIGVSNATGIKIQPYKGIKDIIGVQAPDKLHLRLARPHFIRPPSRPTAPP